MDCQKMQEELINYLEVKKYITDKNIESSELLSQITSIINAQNENLVRLTSQNVQYKKSLKQLQQKVSLQSCNSNNTQSTFMLSSQFKNKFQQFMKQSLSLLIGSYLDTPSKYYEVFLSIVQNYYIKIQSQLESILKKISIVLKVQGQQKQLFKNILKIIQDNHHNIFVIDLNQCYDNFTKAHPQIDIQKQQFQKIYQNYHNIVIYMILQQDRWEIVFGQQKQIEYNKKQYTCIDGWIKEKQKALLLIEGLKKSTGYHANIKNYVIPLPKGYVKPIQLPIMNSHRQIQIPKINNYIQTLQQEQKRIKTVEEQIKVITQNHFEASIQLQKRIRKASVGNIPIKVTAGKIVKQSNKISTDRRAQNQISKGKGDKRNQKQKQNICTNSYQSKITNYKQIIKKKFIKEDNRSLIRSRQRLMCMYDSSVPPKTQRNNKQRQGSSQNRKKKEQNRPLKPTQEHIARFRAKHKLL